MKDYLSETIIWNGPLGMFEIDEFSNGTKSLIDYLKQSDSKVIAGENGNEEIRKELVNWVRKEIGPIASPDLIQFAPNLPKTRSGKIMRRILRKIAENDYSELGDTSTLAEPTVVNELIENRQNK